MKSFIGRAITGDDRAGIDIDIYIKAQLDTAFDTEFITNHRIAYDMISERHPILSEVKWPIYITNIQAICINLFDLVWLKGISNGTVPKKYSFNLSIAQAKHAECKEISEYIDSYSNNIPEFSRLGLTAIQGFVTQLINEQIAAGNNAEDIALYNELCTELSTLAETMLSDLRKYKFSGSVA